MTALDAVVAAAPSLRPDPDPARDWIREELAKREYQPGLTERIFDWVFGLIDKLGETVAGLGRLNPVIALVLLAGLLFFLAVVLTRLRPDIRRRQRPQSGALFTEERVSAAEHRARAERARAAGDHDEAVVEGLRAIAVGLVERAVLDDDPGATAREVASRAGASFPEHERRLRTAADVFDGVRYGDHRADAADADAVLVLEATVRGTRPADRPTGPVLAVPR